MMFRPPHFFSLFPTILQDMCDKIYYNQTRNVKMSDLTLPASRFLQLPLELRRDLYDFLAECEDLTPLAQTCRQLRREVWSRMPGGKETDYGRPQGREQLARQINRHAKIIGFHLVAEPWYSSGSALKVCAEWRPRGSRRYRWTTWTIRDLASPMAQWAFLCRPRHARVVFKPPPLGANQQMALVILCCKVLDIIRMLILIRWSQLGSGTRWPLQNGRGECFLEILFCDRQDRGRCSPSHHARSFWEMRPVFNLCSMRRIRTRIRQGEVSRIPGQDRESYPFFYECLMLPFFGISLWQPQVEFEMQSPARKHTSFFRSDMARHRRYHSVSALCDTARQAARLGMHRFRHVDPERYSEWKRVVDVLDWFHWEIANIMEDEDGPAATQLRSYLRRMRTSHHINAFAGNGHANPPCRLQTVGKSPYRTDYPRADDLMRRKLIRWAYKVG